MSARRAALLERFRSRSRERVGALVSALASAEAPAPDAWHEHLGAVHTIKGESRMLGLVALADAVHAVEDALVAHRDGDVRVSVDRVVSALSLLDAMLGAELVEDRGTREAADHLVAGLANVSVAPRAVAEAGPVVAAKHVEVSLPELDALCEGIESVRAGFARLGGARASDGVAHEELSARIERLAHEAWDLRIAPSEPMLTALARHAEELARQQGKLLNAHVDAEGTTLDRAVLEALAEPLLHLIRNGVDHGLEAPDERGGKGAACTLTLQAVARGAEVALVVFDDGRGIDVAAVRRTAIERGVVDAQEASSLTDDEALDLVFRPGFSTRTRATDLSGRGVGLDVVRRVAESLGGGASVTTELGAGTRFVITAPIGIARERVLLIEVSGALFGISARLVRSVELLDERVQSGPSGLALRTRDGLVPVRSFAELVGFPRGPTETRALVVDIAERRWAIAFSRLAGEREVLRRPADVGLAAFGVAGASAVLDDGRPVLLPTLAELLRRRGSRGVVVTARETASRPLARRALVVDDSPIIRELVSELLTSASFAVTSACDGAAALDVLERQEFDVVVSDLEMPTVDGLELLRRVRARPRPTPFVMVTTRGSADDRKRAFDLGAAGYVVKTDFHEGNLVEVVRRAAGGAS